MDLRFAVRWIVSGPSIISSPSWADTGVSKSSLVENTGDRAAQLVGVFALKWGWLIGIVLIALVVIARSRKAP